MKKINSKITLFAYAVILTVFIISTPLIAGLLNSFMPGETISSSAVNQNFTLLQEGQDDLQNQLDNICNQPGQIIFNGIIDDEGNTVDSFTCDGIQITTSEFVDGSYNVNLDGIDADNVVVQVTALTAALGHLTCHSQILQSINGDFFRINCWNEDTNLTDTAVNITIFRIK